MCMLLRERKNICRTYNSSIYLNNKVFFAKDYFYDPIGIGSETLLGRGTQFSIVQYLRHFLIFLIYIVVLLVC